ncbi:Regulatory protein LEU3 [Daldinia childiae]|uniref:Regulatory protein LEU3 n=1 Tax=Daldinia childiae TaxID=326645 RepID=UPI0014476B7B|nr:Regulatory protein LEU3 [Daldinia childiae]KAF3057375.1 Regulatory protein LEU3 [Daldinia childiae]
MDGHTVVGAVSAPSTSPTSPVSVHRHGSMKRKRSEGGLGIESSPGSVIGDEDQSLAEPEKKRQPGVKRACNECRQQKLRCDVVQEPFQSCSRCNRLKLECKIESNFKRIGKRSKHAEMEKEIDRLRRKIAQAKAQGFVIDDDEDLQSQLQSPVANSAYSHTRNPSLMGSDEAVTSLLTLKRGGSYSLAATHYAYELETVRLTEQDVHGLFQEFFSCYHPFLPFLNEHQSPDLYYQQHALLFWTIIAIASRRYHAKPNILHELSSGPLNRLLWGTVGDVPNSYFVVKALCLLCTWPLPTSTTTADPTHILCGVMMKAATGIGLHRPNHTQDFSRVSVELNKDQLHDRVTTWAVCNIVAQSIGTGYGQPATSLYDWTLAIRPGEDGPFTLSPELEARLRIERFCDKVSKEMYSNASDPRGVAGDEHRAMLMRVYRRDFQELQTSILSQRLSQIVEVHLTAANVHLRLAGFFDSSSTPGYMDDLMGLWRAITSFLDLLFLDANQHILVYATNYIQQMLVAAGFALLKLMRSFFAKTIDFERGRTLFHKTINSIRRTSVLDNDLQWRLAELMVQMWNGARIDNKNNTSFHDDDSSVLIDDTLQLKVRCRHSMSLVFDSIWRWREEYQAQGRGTLDALKHPTNPDSGNESSASSTHMDSTLLPHNNLANLTTMATNNGGITPTASHGLSAGANSMIGLGYGSDANYDFFDPQHWMLDGLLDFNYTFAQPLEGM